VWPYSCRFPTKLIDILLHAFYILSPFRRPWFNENSLGAKESLRIVAFKSRRWYVECTDRTQFYLLTSASMWYLEGHHHDDRQVLWIWMTVGQLNMAGTSLSAFRCDAIALFQRSSFSRLIQIAYINRGELTSTSALPLLPIPQKSFIFNTLK
jgi:hypothetical protein